MKRTHIDAVFPNESVETEGPDADGDIFLVIRTMDGPAAATFLDAEASRALAKALKKSARKAEAAR